MSNTYRLTGGNEEVDVALMWFIIREVNFRTTYLGETYQNIAENAEVATGTLTRMCNGITKRPAGRTLFRLLTTLGFEFDVIQNEVRETVVPLEIKRVDRKENRNGK